MVVTHPLLAVLHAVAAGDFPPADGQAVFLPPLPKGHSAVVSLTGRVYLATDHRIPDLDGFGSALHPDVLRGLAGPTGEIGTLDVTLAANGLGGGDLPPRPDLMDHPRVRHALALREEVRVYGNDRGLVTVAAGLAGRTEISVEVFSSPVDYPEDAQRNCRWPPVAWFEGAGGQADARLGEVEPGRHQPRPAAVQHEPAVGERGRTGSPRRVSAGRELIRDALGLVPADEPVFAAVAPGNARSLRAFLAEGFTPVGSEVIIQP